MSADAVCAFLLCALVGYLCSWIGNWHVIWAAESFSRKLRRQMESATEAQELRNDLLKALEGHKAALERLQPIALASTNAAALIAELNARIQRKGADPDALSMISDFADEFNRLNLRYRMQANGCYWMIVDRESNAVATG